MNPSDPSQVNPPAQPLGTPVPPAQAPVPAASPPPQPAEPTSFGEPTFLSGAGVTPPAPATPTVAPTPMSTEPVAAAVPSPLPEPMAVPVPETPVAPVIPTPEVAPPASAVDPFVASAAQAMVNAPQNAQPVAWSGDPNAGVVPPAPITPQPGVPPAGVIADPYAGMSASGVSAAGGSKKKLRMAVSAVVALVVLASGVTGVMHVLGGSKKYAAKDLVTVTAQHYKLAYPKQWKDVSSNKTLLESALGSSSGISDVKAYAFNVSKDNKTAEAFVLAADEATGISDGQLKQLLDDSSIKKSFEDSMKSSTKDISNDKTCAEATNPSTAFDYNTSDFIAALKYNVDCKAAADSKNKSADHHLLVNMGFKDGKAFIMVIGSIKADWARNSEFYKTSMVSGFHPQ